MSKYESAVRAFSSDAAVENIADLNSGILGTGSALPEKILTNDELSRFVDTSDEWIQERVGILSRHIAGTGETTVSLSELACRRAMEASGVSPDEINLIILGTVTPDQSLPAAAALVQQRLGVPHAMAFDIQAACSGFIFALTLADSLQRAHGFGKALVVGAETLSRIIDWKDRNTCVLFADGAGAVVYDGRRLSQTNKGGGILASELATAGSLSDYICRPGSAFPPDTLPSGMLDRAEDRSSPYVHMKGRETFKAGITVMSSSIEAVLRKAGVGIDEVTMFIPHQSNKRMIDAVCERVGLTDSSRVVYNLDRIGNTSAASIPIALDEVVKAGRLKRGDLLLLTAVGGGLTYGSVLLRW